MKKTLLVVSLMFCAQICFGWGQNGHRIVAQVCYDNLSDQAKKEIDSVLGNQYLTQVATWPDFIRSEKNWDFAKNWHFVTIDPGLTAEDVIKAKEDNDTIDNVIEAIDLMRGILKDDAASIKTFQDLMDTNHVKPLNGSIKATAIAFLVHFIGDIHQPMHVGKNNDHGGNSITVEFFGESSNLHSVWDEGIIQQEQLSYTEFAAFVNKKQACHKQDLIKKKKVAEWANESVTDRETIYNTLYDKTDFDTGLPSFSYNYQHDFLPVVEKRLGAAGYRAAEVFNSIFK